MELVLEPELNTTKSLASLRVVAKTSNNII
jgi:hypothetical protein